MILLENIKRKLSQPADTELIGYSLVWLNELDKRRKSDFVSLFPEYKDFIEDYKKYIKPIYTNEHMKKWSY